VAQHVISELTDTNENLTVQDSPSSKTFPRKDKTHRLKETLDKNQLILLSKSQRTQKCQRPSAYLRDLVDANKIDLSRKDSNYLWEVCNLDQFKPFMSDSSAGKSSAIQRMHKELM